MRCVVVLAEAAEDLIVSTFPIHAPCVSASRGAGAGTCLVVPSHILGRDGALPPSERLNIARIGVAGQDGQDLNQFPKENIVALCFEP
jgi:hypothetical protein